MHLLCLTSLHCLYCCLIYVLFSCCWSPLLEDKPHKGKHLVPTVPPEYRTVPSSKKCSVNIRWRNSCGAKVTWHSQTALHTVQECATEGERERSQCLWRGHDKEVIMGLALERNRTLQSRTFWCWLSLMWHLSLLIWMSLIFVLMVTN